MFNFIKIAYAIARKLETLKYDYDYIKILLLKRFKMTPKEKINVV